MKGQTASLHKRGTTSGEPQPAIAARNRRRRACWTRARWLRRQQRRVVQLRNERWIGPGEPLRRPESVRRQLPGRLLPGGHLPVQADGPGTTNNFTKYLVAAAPTAWKLGSGDTVAWPASTQGGDKNTGVAQIVEQADGAIGYVDLSDASELKLTFASIKNKDGQFVAPTLEGAAAAIEGDRRAG